MEKKVSDDISCWKVQYQDHYNEELRGTSHLICSLRYKNMNEIPIVWHNGLNYECHSIKKELSEESGGQL